MPHYKLRYFGTVGIGESIRFLLSYGGQDFEDIRNDIHQWPGIKPTTPYGRLPILEIDGEVHHQSLAICRYLAKEFNLAGKDNLEDLRIDTMADTINDYRLVFTSTVWPPNGEDRTEKLKSLINEHIPYYLQKFEEQVKKNGGYFVGGKVTWADVYFASLKPYLDFVAGIDTLKDYPILNELTEKIYAIPNIRKWIDKRPTECSLRDFLAGK